MFFKGYQNANSGLDLDAVFIDRDFIALVVQRIAFVYIVKKNSEAGEISNNKTFC